MLIYYITGQLLAVFVNSAQIKASKAASSNAIPTALGNKAGIPKQRMRKKGAAKPIASHQTGPQMNPHRSTGICIGQSILPTVLI